MNRRPPPYREAPSPTRLPIYPMDHVIATVYDLARTLFPPHCVHFYFFDFFFRARKPPILL